MKRMGLNHIQKKNCMQADFTKHGSIIYIIETLEERRKERLTLDHKKENRKQD